MRKCICCDKELITGEIFVMSVVTTGKNKNQSILVNMELCETCVYISDIVKIVSDKYGTNISNFHIWRIGR